MCVDNVAGNLSDCHAVLGSHESPRDELDEGVEQVEAVLAAVAG
jgi:hypothetical protein